MSIPIDYFCSDNYRPYRSVVMERLYLNFHNSGLFKPLYFTQREEIVKNIENSIYKSAKEEYSNQINNNVIFIDDENFIQFYSMSSYRIIDFLDSNLDICKDIIEDVDLQKRIAFISSEDLAPEHYMTIINGINIRKNQVFEKKLSTQYQCPKCRAKRAEVETVQLRSFDEPANISALCDECGFRWIL